jgi:hypothetical protein
VLCCALGAEAALAGATVWAEAAAAKPASKNTAHSCFMVTLSAHARAQVEE